MIIVFNEDQTVFVCPNISSVRTECETVDVEDGVYRFFDEGGRRLIPRFTLPVKRSKLIFGTLVGGGSFELDLDPQDDGSCFDAALADAVGMETTVSFRSLADLALFVEENRRQPMAVDGSNP